MYLKFFGFREQPFGVTPDPRFLYLSPSHREAMASLDYGIEANRGFLRYSQRALEIEIPFDGDVNSLRGYSHRGGHHLAGNLGTGS